MDVHTHQRCILCQFVPHFAKIYEHITTNKILNKKLNTDPTLVDNSQRCKRKQYKAKQNENRMDQGWTKTYTKNQAEKHSGKVHSNYASRKLGQKHWKTKNTYYLGKGKHLGLGRYRNETQVETLRRRKRRQDKGRDWHQNTNKLTWQTYTWQGKQKQRHMEQGGRKPRHRQENGKGKHETGGKKGSVLHSHKKKSSWNFTVCLKKFLHCYLFPTGHLL